MLKRTDLGFFFLINKFVLVHNNSQLVLMCFSQHEMLLWFKGMNSEHISYFHIRWMCAVEKPMNILYMCAQLIGSPWNYDGHYKLASDQIYHHNRGWGNSKMTHMAPHLITPVFIYSQETIKDEGCCSCTTKTISCIISTCVYLGHRRQSISAAQCH